MSWLKHGDRNTKNFHSKASQRRRRNYIEGIKNANGVWVEEVDEVADVVSDYFIISLKKALVTEWRNVSIQLFIKLPMIC